MYYESISVQKEREDDVDAYTNDKNGEERAKKEEINT